MCNHLCGSVDSVPHHKIFAGFGKSSTLQYLSSVQVGRVEIKAAPGRSNRAAYSPVAC